MSPKELRQALGTQRFYTPNEARGLAIYDEHIAGNPPGASQIINKVELDQNVFTSRLGFTASKV